MLIENNEMLRRFVPNVVNEVPGEKSLLDKIAPFLEQSENFVREKLLGEEIYSNIESMTNILVLSRSVVAFDATFRSIASLDVVLTPNGFGIVNNNNISPASAERVKNLQLQYEKSRDTAIFNLLNYLYESNEWRESYCARYFLATLIPTSNLAEIVGEYVHQWERYDVLRAKVISIEFEIAEKFISHELMEELRQGIVLDPHSSHLKGILQNYVIKRLADVEGKICLDSYLKNAVNYMLANIEHFPTWRNSPQYLNFNPVLFKNKKENGGFWS